LAPQSSTRRLESSMVKVIRSAEENSFPLHKVDQLRQISQSISYVFRPQASLPLHTLNPNCDPGTQRNVRKPGPFLLCRRFREQFAKARLPTLLALIVVTVASDFSLKNDLPGD
jgi:hypothetical protein